MTYDALSVAGGRYEIREAPDFALINTVTGDAASVAEMLEWIVAAGWRFRMDRQPSRDVGAYCLVLERPDIPGHGLSEQGYGDTEHDVVWNGVYTVWEARMQFDDDNPDELPSRRPA